MARLDWKRFRDEKPKVGSRIIRALYDRNHTGQPGSGGDSALGEEPKDRKPNRGSPRR